MSLKLDIKKILKDNPQVSTELLRKAQKLGLELRKLGTLRRGYRLTSPTARERVRAAGGVDHDPRTIKLHR
jgi:hypothetical protein